VHDLLDRHIKGRKVQGLGTQIKETDAGNDDTSLSDQAIKAFISTVSKRLNLDGGLSTNPNGAKSKKKKFVRKECLAADYADQSTFLSVVFIIILWFLRRSSLLSFEMVMAMPPITRRQI
jgi:hypothetical protein